MTKTRKKWLGRFSLLMALVIPPSVVVLFRDWHVDNWIANVIRVIFVPAFWREGPPWFLLGLYLVFAVIYLVLRNWRYAVTVVVLPIVCAWLLTLALFAYGETHNRDDGVTTSTVQAPYPSGRSGEIRSGETIAP